MNGVILGDEGLWGFLGTGWEREGKICWYFLKDIKDEIRLSESLSEGVLGKWVTRGVDIPCRQ